MQSLDVPSRTHEFSGYPVEQPGMAGPLTSDSKVPGRGDQTGAKKLLPHAVYSDSSCQRIVLGNQPLRQFQTSRMTSRISSGR